MRLLIAILLLSWTTPSFAQDDTIPALNAAGSAAMAEGRHREAADYFGRALQALEAQGGTGHATIIVIGDNLAMALFSAGLAADGAAAFAGLDARRDAMDAADPAGHARYLRDRAGAYRALNRNAEASALLARLAALQRDRLEDQRDAAEQTLALAAFLADAAGQYAQSAALYRELTELRSALHGETDTRTLNARGNLGYALHAAGQNAEARRVLEGLLPLLPSGSDSEGVVLSNLASIARAQERHDDAEALYRRAVVFHEARGETLALADALNNLAVALYGQHRADEAVSLYRRALAIYEDVLAETHPTLALARINLAAALEDLGDAAEAEALYRSGLASQEAIYGPAHPALATTLGNLGLLRAKAGDTAEALALLARATQLRRAYFPPGDASRAAAETVQARQMLESEGDTLEALNLSRAATDGLIDRSFAETGSTPSRELTRFARYFEVRLVALWAVAETSGRDENPI
jgi:tetratricopeptide (TPR) repeat protein